MGRATKERRSKPGERALLALACAALPGCSVSTYASSADGIAGAPDATFDLVLASAPGANLSAKIVTESSGRGVVLTHSAISGALEVTSFTAEGAKEWSRSFPTVAPPVDESAALDKDGNLFLILIPTGSAAILLSLARDGSERFRNAVAGDLLLSRVAIVGDLIAVERSSKPGAMPPVRDVATFTRAGVAGFTLPATANRHVAFGPKAFVIERCDGGSAPTGCTLDSYREDGSARPTLALSAPLLGPPIVTASGEVVLQTSDTNVAVIGEDGARRLDLGPQASFRSFQDLGDGRFLGVAASARGAAFLGPNGVTFLDSMTDSHTAQAPEPFVAGNGSLIAYFSAARSQLCMLGSVVPGREICRNHGDDTGIAIRLQGASAYVVSSRCDAPACTAPSDRLVLRRFESALAN